MGHYESHNVTFDTSNIIGGDTFFLWSEAILVLPTVSNRMQHRGPRGAAQMRGPPPPRAVGAPRARAGAFVPFDTAFDDMRREADASVKRRQAVEACGACEATAGPGSGGVSRRRGAHGGWSCKRTRAPGAQRRARCAGRARRRRWQRSCWRAAPATTCAAAPPPPNTHTHTHTHARGALRRAASVRPSVRRRRVEPLRCEQRRAVHPDSREVRQDAGGQLRERLRGGRRPRSRPHSRRARRSRVLSPPTLQVDRE